MYPVARVCDARVAFDRQCAMPRVTAKRDRTIVEGLDQLYTDSDLHSDRVHSLATLAQH